MCYGREVSVRQDASKRSRRRSNAALRHFSCRTRICGSGPRFVARPSTPVLRTYARDDTAPRFVALPSTPVLRTYARDDTALPSTSVLRTYARDDTAARFVALPSTSVLRTYARDDTALPSTSVLRTYARDDRAPRFVALPSTSVLRTYARDDTGCAFGCVSARSWPHAAAISRPMFLRTVVGTPSLSSTAANSQMRSSLVPANDPSGVVL